MVKRFFLCFFFLSVCNLIVAADFNPSLQRILRITTHIFDYNLDPHTANYNSEAQLLINIHEGLFSYNPQNLEAAPAIAKNFKVSRNKLTWTFTLRDDAFFSDGTPITATSVRDSWLKLLDPSTNAPFASLIDCIENAKEYRKGETTKDKVGITARDDKTLVVRLTNPTGHLPKILCNHAFTVVSPKKDVYSGAFTLESISKEKIILKKNPKYWDARNVALPGVEITFSDDEELNTFNFNAGKSDWVLSDINPEKILDKEAIKIGKQFGTTYIFFKSQKAPWNNSDARNALIAATPIEELQKNSLIKAKTLMLPLRGYPDIVGVGEYDLEYAKSLAEKAGLKDAVIVFGISDEKYSFEMASILEKAWKEIGVKLVIQKTPTNRYLDSINGWDADLFTYTWIGDFADPQAFLELFRSESTLNETKWHNSDYDNILKEASLLTDDNKRYQKLSEAEQLLLDSGVIIPISHPISLNIVDSSILSGWTENALDIYLFKYIYFKEAVQKLKIVKAN